MNNLTAAERTQPQNLAQIEPPFFQSLNVYLKSRASLNCTSKSNPTDFICVLSLDYFRSEHTLFLLCYIELHYFYLSHMHQTKNTKNNKENTNKMEIPLNHHQLSEPVSIHPIRVKPL